MYTSRSCRNCERCKVETCHLTISTRLTLDLGVWIRICASIAAPSDRNASASRAPRIPKSSAEVFGVERSLGHSLRAGLVTAAAIAGKGAHVIMKTSRHRSLAMLNRYIRDAELFRDNAAADLL